MHLNLTVRQDFAAGRTSSSAELGFHFLGFICEENILDALVEVSLLIELVLVVDSVLWHLVDLVIVLGLENEALVLLGLDWWPWELPEVRL